MAEKDFNLIEEAWIKVLTIEGKEEKVSLLDVFRRAHEFKTLAGELPTQDIAVLRLLLAILYAVFTLVDKDGKPAPITDAQSATERWRQLWEMGSFPCKPIEQYLNHYKERFYLIHPEKPFYQVAGMKTNDDKVNPVAQMIADVPSRIERRFFSNKNGKGALELDYDEAARWLVNLQAWDYAGKKASILGGTPNGGGTGWLGKLGVVYSHSDNLFATLLLNMVLLDESSQLLSLGKPIWEHEPKTVARIERAPAGYVELLTWQSRRVLLFNAEEKINGILSSYGDVFVKDNTFIEQMSGWHKSNAENYIPNLHNSSRSLWRDLASILPQVDENGINENRVSGTVIWPSILKSQGLIDSSYINICAIGAEYGPMQGVINELISDSVSINASMITNVGRTWLKRVFENINKTDQCVWGLGTLAFDLAAATGNDDTNNKKGISAAAREQAYFNLDIPFRTWLARIDPEVDDLDEKSNLWLEHTKHTILKMGEQLVAEAGSRAISGTYKKDPNANRTEIANAAKALSKFRTTIYKTIKGGGN